MNSFLSNATKAYDAYWRFAFNRQEAFYSKMNNEPQPWTEDSIIQKYRFTNPYRITDRVSQYLVRNVIYSKDNFTAEDILFRILLFKIFNKIDTWEYLEDKLGEIRYSEYNEEIYSRLLDELIEQKQKIYSAAYIMPSGVTSFGYTKKHRNNLALLSYMFSNGLSQKLAQSKSLQELYQLLLSFPTIGSFLAFQYAIDINYSELCDFDEMSFVVAGPGARSGIEKCFNLECYDYTEAIRFVADNQEEEFEKRGYKFKTLFGRKLQLIDCQNLFCETDKYTRIYCPEISSTQNRIKIKQIYTPNLIKFDIFLPPKWGVKVVKGEK